MTARRQTEPPIAPRVCADVEDGVTIFLIGMRLNKLWKIWRWLPVLTAMPKMLRELAMHPELGLLHARPSFGLRNAMVLQYWKSPAHPQAYAQSRDHEHLPAWRAFNRIIGTNGDVGIWHETYVVPPGHMESIYVNMPRTGLGIAGTLAAATCPRASAAQRLAERPAQPRQC